jgi:hypothetical protein
MFNQNGQKIQFYLKGLMMIVEWVWMQFSTVFTLRLACNS